MEPWSPRHRFAELSEKIRAFQQSLQNVNNHPTKKDLVKHLRTAKDLGDKVELFIEKDRASLGEIRRHLISAHQTESSCLCHAVEELLERSKVLQQCLQAVRSFLERERNALSAVRKNLTSSSQPQRQASSAGESIEHGANAVGATLSVKQTFSFAGSRSASASASTPVDMRTSVGSAFAVKPPSVSTLGEKLPISSDAAATPAPNRVESLANDSTRTSVTDEVGKQPPHVATNPAFIDYNAVFLNSPSFAANFRNTMAAIRSVDLSRVDPTQLLNAAELNARAFQHSERASEERRQAKSAGKRSPNDVVLAQLHRIQLELCLRSQFQPQSRAGNAAEVFVHGIGAVGASPSVQPSPVTGSSSTATSAPNSRKVQLLAGYALGEKPADAAISPFAEARSTSSGAAPAKKSRLCDKHVALAHSIARQKSSAAANHWWSPVACRQDQPSSSQNTDLPQDKCE